MGKRPWVADSNKRRVGNRNVTSDLLSNTFANKTYGNLISALYIRKNPTFNVEFVEHHMKWTTWSNNLKPKLLTLGILKVTGKGRRTTYHVDKKMLEQVLHDNLLTYYESQILPAFRRSFLTQTARWTRLPAQDSRMPLRTSARPKEILDRKEAYAATTQRLRTLLTISCDHELAFGLKDNEPSAWKELERRLRRIVEKTDQEAAKDNPLQRLIHATNDRMVIGDLKIIIRNRPSYFASPFYIGFACATVEKQLQRSRKFSIWDIYAGVLQFLGAMNFSPILRDRIYPYKKDNLPSCWVICLNILSLDLHFRKDHTASEIHRIAREYDELLTALTA